MKKIIICCSLFLSCTAATVQAQENGDWMMDFEGCKKVYNTITDYSLGDPYVTNHQLNEVLTLPATFSGSCVKGTFVIIFAGLRYELNGKQITAPLPGYCVKDNNNSGTWSLPPINASIPAGATNVVLQLNPHGYTLASLSGSPVQKSGGPSRGSYAIKIPSSVPAPAPVKVIRKTLKEKPYKKKVQGI